MEGKRASWSGQLAFVLAAAASAIGLGNLWRFPYLAAQYGGGMFLVVYYALVFTLGFSLMLTEISIGRKTRQSQLTAYNQLHGHYGLKILGLVATIIPLLITPYYCVIGGWVLYYLKAFAAMCFTGTAPMGAGAAESAQFFTSFISAPFAPFGYAMIFILICAGVIVLGVKNGIEKSNMVMMPTLFIMALLIAGYVVYADASQNDWQGIKYYLVPNIQSLCDDTGSFSFAMLGKMILGAMGQMFYSLSLAMGIMVTYGSYMNKHDNIQKCAQRIGFFDTFFATISGLMIIPMVYMFAVKSGMPIKEAMSAGPGLMFISLPKVFAMFGTLGPWIGFAFFILVTFAAATSAISLFEACVASVCDVIGIERKAATFFTSAMILFLAVFSAIGYGPWAEVKLFGMQFLDFFDFITNSALMPITAAVTCIFIGWILGPKAIVDEVEAGGTVFTLKKFYMVMVKYFCPAFVIAILVSEICRALGIGGWKI